MTTKTLLYINNEIQIKDVPETPWMDPEGLNLFKELAENSQCYLEFGSGGSTVYMIRSTSARNIISVDSDKEWVEKINRAIDEKQRNRLHLEYCDVGHVGAWGVPSNNSHIHSYWTYMATPWKYAAQNGLKPDLLLIDGRFRVASFLFSMLSAEIGSTILFDDYLDRPEYFVVEQFCKLSKKVGRMGVFSVTKDYSVPEICKSIAKYSINYD